MVDFVHLAKRWRLGFSSHFDFSIFEKIVLVIFISLALDGCHDYGADPKDSPTPQPPPLPDDVALYVTMDDADGIGLWILNANTLELIETMPTRPGVPWTIEFLPEYTTWYSCWGRMNIASILGMYVRLQFRIASPFSTQSML